MPINYNDIIVHDFRMLFQTDGQDDNQEQMNDDNIQNFINNVFSENFVNLVFGTFETQPHGELWIEQNWQSASYYYNVNPQLSPLANQQTPRQFNIPNSLTADHLLYFYSHRQRPRRHWHLGQAHASLDRYFPVNNLPVAIVNLTDKRVIIRAITPGHINANGILTHTYENDANYPVLTVLPHLIYPYIFPVWFKGTGDGYSQITGLNRLLDDICFHARDLPGNANHNLSKRPDLNFYNNYDQYSAAYRFLLRLYQIWRGDNFAAPHFDYFTQFLAELDPRPMPQKMLEMKKALILYGVPGTGKTHEAREIANRIAEPQNIKFVQFHPNYSYADFIIGIKPETTENVGITYPTVPGLLYRIAAEAHWLGQLNGNANPIDPKARNIVLIIDEINRANLAAVLGEVMYLLEYRCQTLTLPQTLSPNTPITRVPEMREDAAGANQGGLADNPNILGDPFNGGRQFAIPQNLFIIGTMNHADRSIAGFDMALRRRFAWYRTEPDYEALREMIRVKSGEPNIDDDSIESFVDICQKFNEKIGENTNSNSLPLTKDHLIGHAYFAEIGSIVRSESPNATKIERQHREILWLYYILPLLEDFLGSEVNRSTQGLNDLRKILVGD